MALTAPEKTAFLQARLAAIESFLAIAFPSFVGDYIEATSREVDAHPDLPGGKKQEAKDEMEILRTKLKKK